MSCACVVVRARAFRRSVGNGKDGTISKSSEQELANQHSLYVGVSGRVLEAQAGAFPSTFSPPFKSPDFSQPFPAFSSEKDRDSWASREAGTTGAIQMTA